MMFVFLLRRGVGRKERAGRGKDLRIKDFFERSIGEGGGDQKGSLRHGLNCRPLLKKWRALLQLVKLNFQRP